MSNIINSLKRLERLGSETSGTTLKLVRAARDVAGLIAACFTANDFRWNEQMAEYDTIEIDSSTWRGQDGFYIYMDAGTRETFLFTNGDSNLNPSGDALPNRYAALHLAEAIAGGLLDEIANQLETMRDEDDLATSHLVAAMQPATNLAMGLPVDAHWTPAPTGALRVEDGPVEPYVVDLGKL
jgi:hypothetical protein